MIREKKTDLKFCIDRKSEFSRKLSDYFEDGKVLPFEELWENRAQIELTEKGKRNYDIIQFSFVILNNDDKPLFIERKEKSHHITTGGSILQSCSPVMILRGTFPRSMDDIRFYFEQEVKIERPKPPDYKIDLIGIGRNVRKSINYYFYIFRIKFPVKKPNLSLRKDPDVILGFYDPDSKRQLLEGKKVDLRALKVLFPQFEVPPEEVEGCILHKEVNNNFRDMLFTTKKPEIRVIRIPDIKKDFIRVCLVQLGFSLTKNFPYTLEEDDKAKVKKKIFGAVEIAKKERVDIVCFPELSFIKEWINEVKKYRNMIVICGSFYDDNNFNVCPVIVDGDEYLVGKINPSPYLEAEISLGKGMNLWKKDIKIFATENGKIKFGVLICIDYLSESHRLYHYENDEIKGVNFIFNPSFNLDVDRFQKRADLDCEDYPVDIMQTNVMKYGGTCIIGVEYERYLNRLIDEGYKPGEDSIKYKLCQADGEMMIIANLHTKGVEVPVGIKAKPRIGGILQYKYENEGWRK